jgi:hypothetical protein
MRAQKFEATASVGVLLVSVVLPARIACCHCSTTAVASEHCHWYTSSSITAVDLVLLVATLLAKLKLLLLLHLLLHLLLQNSIRLEQPRVKHHVYCATVITLHCNRLYAPKSNHL